MPWDEERRKRTKAKLDKEAERVKARLGARTVAIIAFFDDGNPSLMLLEGGTAPIPSEDLYRALAEQYKAHREKLAKQSEGQPKPTNDEPSRVQ